MRGLRGITAYQLEILQLVAAGGPDGSLDFDQLLDKLSWYPSKHSAQFTIRAVMAKKLMIKEADLELRRGRRRVLYQLTAAGREVLDPRSAAVRPPVAIVPGVAAAVVKSTSGPVSEVIPELEIEEPIVPGVEDLDDFLESLEP
jgi:DNA-binding PadR family transcriptional regulator